MDPFDSSVSLGGGASEAAAGEDLDRPDGSLPWARFSAWLECVCVVTFDLELGQAIEVGIQSSPHRRPCGKRGSVINIT